MPAKQSGSRLQVVVQRRQPSHLPGYLPPIFPFHRSFSGLLELFSPTTSSASKDHLYAKDSSVQEGQITVRVIRTYLERSPKYHGPMSRDSPSPRRLQLKIHDTPHTTASLRGILLYLSVWYAGRG